MTDQPNPTRDPTPRGGPTGTDAVIAAWSGLDRLAQGVVGGSIAVLVITVVGLPFGTWPSTDFVLLVLAVDAVALVAAMLGVHSRDPEPLAMLEAGAAAVVAVLAVSNLVEIVFDLGQGGLGWIIGLVFAVGLAVAGALVVFDAIRRLGGVRALHLTQGRGAAVAAAGFIAVVVGWAVNLSIGHGTMAQAALSLAVLTAAVAVILASRRISSPIPAAWAGVVLAVFGAILAFGQWSDLVTLGRTGIELGPVDFLGFLGYVIGLVAIVVGGVMTALEQRPVTFAMDAVDSDPPAGPPDRIG